MPLTCPRRKRLTRLCLGLVEDEEARELLAHLGSCPACAAEHRRTQELFHGLGAAAAPVARTAALDDVRSRLLGSAGRELRLEHLVPLVGRHLEIGEAEARQVLGLIDDPSAWGRGPGPGVSVQRLRVGARCQSTLTNLIRLVGGARFPEHGHLGDEVVVVLQGQMREASGAVHHSGAEVLAGTATEHGFDALPGPDLVCLVIVEGGVIFGEHVLRA